MKLFYCDHIEIPIRRGSKFPVTKYRQLRERVVQLDDSSLELIQSRAVSTSTLRLAHTAQYVDAVVKGNLSAESQRIIGFPWSPELVARSRHSVGATIAACKAAMKDSVGVNLAGGTHHARAGSGGGYCVFNDVAVAARFITANDNGARILIIDADVHQGDGSAEILAQDDRIYTFSIHCMDNYPRKKAHSNLDIPIMADTGDVQYLRQFESGLTQAALASRPSFVIYLAGADPFVGDRLGKLALSKKGLIARDEKVFDLCRRMFLPLAVVMGGGYAEDINDIVDIHLATIMGTCRLAKGN